MKLFLKLTLFFPVFPFDPQGESRGIKREHWKEKGYLILESSSKISPSER